MKRIHIRTRPAWRAWLAENHVRVEDGVWLVFERQPKTGTALRYEEAVLEALCFGWIDSVIRKIDDRLYCRKFTPRNLRSLWSASNRARVEKLIRDGLMTEPGLTKVEAAKRTGRWEAEGRRPLGATMPAEFKLALSRSPKAKAFYESLAPSYRRQFAGWIGSARRPETRARRVKESVALLEQCRRMGLR